MEELISWAARYKWDFENVGRTHYVGRLAFCSSQKWEMREIQTELFI